MKTINQKLESIGFKMVPRNICGVSGLKTVFGTKPAADEFLDVGKDHFTPKKRDVFVGETFDHRFYVTSHLIGNRRGYRCRHSHQEKIANIFASGKTKHEAVNNFLKEFREREVMKTTYMGLIEKIDAKQKELVIKIRSNAQKNQELLQELKDASHAAKTTICAVEILSHITRKRKEK